LITGVSSRRNHRLRRGNAAHHRRAQGQDPSSRRSSAAPVARRNLVAPHTAASHEDTSSDRSGASLACAALGRQRRWRYADRRSLAPPIGDRRSSASPKVGLAARAYPPRSHHNSLSSPFNQPPRRGSPRSGVACSSPSLKHQGGLPPVAPLGETLFRPPAGRNRGGGAHWWR